MKEMFMNPFEIHAAYRQDLLLAEAEAMRLAKAVRASGDASNEPHLRSDSALLLMLRWVGLVRRARPASTERSATI